MSTAAEWSVVESWLDGVGKNRGHVYQVWTIDGPAPFGGLRARDGDHADEIVSALNASCQLASVVATSEAAETFGDFLRTLAAAVERDAVCQADVEPTALASSMAQRPPQSQRRWSSRWTSATTRSGPPWSGLPSGLEWTTMGKVEQDMELPEEADESLVFCSDEHADPPYRGVLVSDGANGYTVSFENGERDQETRSVGWSTDGCVTPSDLHEIWVALALLFRGCNRVASDLVDMMASGKSEFPFNKPVTIMRSSGKLNVRLASVGSTQDGDPFMQLEFKRPLKDFEMFVLSKRLAKACDWYAERMACS